tara:strand:+ start:11183 stop:11794 length:612 start_codon:yes stop_codon:yes gene_type:complete
MPRSPKYPVPAWQPSIRGFTQPGVVPNPELAIIPDALTRGKAQTLLLALKPHSGHFKLLGAERGICYFRDPEFYHYYAYEPVSQRRVGELELDDEHALINIKVRQDFRLRGIGKKLVYFANKTNLGRHQEARLIVFAGQAHNSRYRLTAEGHALIHSCLRHRILQHDQVIAESMRSPTQRSSVSPAHYYWGDDSHSQPSSSQD